MSHPPPPHPETRCPRSGSPPPATRKISGNAPPPPRTAPAARTPSPAAGYIWLKGAVSFLLEHTEHFLPEHRRLHQADHDHHQRLRHRRDVRADVPHVH